MTHLTIDTPEQLRDLLGVDWTFSDQQFAAITAPLEPAVVIAGAGSGKTAVMAARVVWLVATGRVSPGEVLGLTFTTKATAELQKRVRDSLRVAGLLPEPGPRTDDEEEVEEPTVVTYHAYAAALLTEHGLRIGHEPDTRLIADASRYQLAARAVQRHTGPVEQLSDHPPTVVQNLLALDGQLSEHLVDPDQLRSHDATERPRFEAGMAGESRKTYREKCEKAISAIDRRAELLDLIVGYRHLKSHLGLMDFSDQISLAARLAEQCPEVGAIERSKFKIVLLDEYQDTSVAQALMLSRLFSGPDADAGLGHPVTAVGDPNQAIYGWRGASVSNILEFGRDFPSRDGRPTTYPLTVNRRSDERILATANHLAADLYALRPELLPLEPKPGAVPGEVHAIVHETYDDELAWLAEQVLATHADLAARTDQPCWREIGVLTRDNAHAAAVFDALSDREIPVEIVGLKGLLRLPEVSEVVATLSLIQDVTANAALLTLLAGPRWAIGPRDLALLGRRARQLAGAQGGGQEFATVQAQLSAAVEGVRPDRDPVALRRARRSGRPRLLQPRLGTGSGCWPASCVDCDRRSASRSSTSYAGSSTPPGIDVELASSVSPAAEARRENLDLFVQAVAEFQAVDGQVTLAALLAWLEAEDEFGQGLDVATPSEADSVKLLTVHRAKGLEWDAVFLVGVTETKFPTNRGRSSWLTVPFMMPNALRGDARDLPVLGGHSPADITAFAKAAKDHEALEELRLGYVAWTRARAPARGLGMVLGPAPQERPRPVGVPRPDAGGHGLLGRRAASLARLRRQGRDQPVRRPLAGPALADLASHGGGGAPAARRPTGCGRPRSTSPTPWRTCWCSTRSGSGTRRSPGCSTRRLATGPRDRGPTAAEPVGHVAGPAARRPRGVRPRPGPADAATAVARSPVRHPLPCVGRDAVRSAGAARSRRAAGPGRRRISMTMPICAT